MDGYVTMSDEIECSKSFGVLWSDLDPNGHMRGPRYLDYAAEMPFHFLIENGFDLRLFSRNQVGPLTFRQAVNHLKEVRFGERITVDIRLRGLSSDGSRWAFRHRIRRRDGEEAAVIETEGAFFSRKTRAIAPPPVEVIEIVRRLPKEEDFAEILVSS